MPRKSEQPQDPVDRMAAAVEQLTQALAVQAEAINGLIDINQQMLVMMAESFEEPDGDSQPGYLDKDDEM